MNDSIDDNTRILLEAYRLSEERLKAQTSSALAADSRAMAFAGLLVAASAILAGLSTSSPNTDGMLWGAAILIIAAIFSGLAARPIDFYMAGAKAGDVYIDASQSDFLEEIKQLSGFNDKHIVENYRKMKHNNDLFRISFVCALLGVAWPILVQLCTP
ncbi:hypothetical protein F9L33_14605 [Amylibacter sp. SFDW26]|uniref:hypothetical protein n=1 Tax=Amylibacter sp. SFDW26 TaxID=2652722 RepID=UPI001262AAD2|nr:hypothetical protein [Amylibacter sp. SFDW26]KAB7610124.1 hypothetical protein F9L33_14605 [Amylibacter sp. SFDW26]